MGEGNMETKKEAINNKPLVFISHDTRDAKLAEAFSNLLKSVSAGVLKTFRSSDKRGNQGIEYGVEWYPEIMKKLQESTSVVCLLTPNSLDRPWILFEAGVAKGKLDTSILGICIGIQLREANSGPFAQFQNCGDDEDSLTKLVIQLVETIPNAEPDEEIIQGQVKVFKKNVAEILEMSVKLSKINTEVNNTENEVAIANLYEEMKIMIKELPYKIKDNVNKDSRNIKKSREMVRFFDEIFLYGDEFDSEFSIKICLSFFRNDFPWIYEVGNHVINACRRGSRRKIEETIMLFDRAMKIANIYARRDENNEYYNELFDRTSYLMRKYYEKNITRKDSEQISLPMHDEKI